ncbi:RNA-binding cell elongation regulator Jag/EloR [Kosmotoga sp. DU53]|uniref:RNA-binding cell elongation regulator Jag/EloR n=1 Tax=Kosmotoga sp. DU53 TaxID=1310160 RepID=UPI0007C50647|nr:RNA-binding cell elongation regulator Jag/EloR [Kosmotoga sp. DU53]OAA24030.1 single-stranded DNA-binding protein [Kosmotoga sp. DU53]
MKTVVVSAPSVDEAVRLAQIKLDAYEDEIEVKVIEKGSKGFLGIFGGKATKIEAKLLPKYFERKLSEYLKGILHHFGEDIFFDVTFNGKTFKVIIEGDNISRLIGRHGKTVSALQHILNIYANRLSDIKVNVSVDVGNYKRERSELVVNMAHKIVRKVKKQKGKVILEPMFAFERRIVHEIVSQYDGVRSYSIGLEPYRRVVVEYSGNGNGRNGARKKTGRFKNVRAYSNRKSS